MNSWLFPSVVANLMGATVLTVTYYFLYRSDRKRYLAIWTAGWGVYALRFLLLLFYLCLEQGLLGSIVLMFHHMAALGSGILLLWGTYGLMDKGFPRQWIYLGAAGFGYILLAGLMTFSLFWLSFPTYFFLGGAYVWTGLVMLRQQELRGPAVKIVGTAFVVWGLHKFDYPFLRPVAAFAPWGYLLGAALEIVIALGMLMVYFQRSKQQLLQGERLYQTVFETAQDAIFVADADTGILVDANQSAEKLTGYAREQFIGRHQTFLHPADRSEFYHQAFKKSVNGKERQFFEMLVRHQNGTHVPVEISSGGVVQVGTRNLHVGIFRDVSERKQVEDNVKKSEALLASTQAMAKVGGWEWNEEEKTMYWTREMYRIYGQAPEKDLSASRDKIREFAACLAPPDRQVLDASFRRCLKQAVPYDVELPFTTRTGRKLYLRMTGEPVMKNGRVVRVIGNMMDTTDRTLAGQELRRLAAAVQQASEGVVVTETDGQIVYVNPAFENITGYPREEILGQTPRILKSGVHDRAFYQHLWDTILDGRYWRGRVVNQRKDGTLYTAECSIAPVKAADGRIENFVWVTRDITNILELENRLAQSQKIEAIGALAGGIAHDFNNLLFPIVGMAEMLMEDLPPGSGEYQNATEILRAAQRGSDLVKQILAFSRQMEHRIIPMKIQSILKEVVKLSRSLVPADFDIRQDIQKDCGLVMADPSQVHQIAMNLVTNAYHAVEPTGGSIFIGLKERRIAEQQTNPVELVPGVYAVVTVSDTGVGIEDGIRDKIFDPYFTTKAQGKGTGLGLAVVYGIIKDLRGDIRVQSAPGRGTTVEVFFPLMAKTQEEPQGLDFPAAVETGTEAILLVDDEPTIVRLEQQMLERLGYHVTAFTNSMAALEAVRRHPEAFDMVMTDMTMPVLTGDQLASEILAVRPDLPIIMCTGFSERIDRKKAEALGIRGFLMKPVVKADMARMVRTVLDADNESNSKQSAVTKAFQ